GRTAFLFEPGNARALADAIRQALELDSTARERLSREARAHARANFSRDHMCAATLAVYREILRAAEAEASALPGGRAAPSGTAAGS
ncbi:MAG: glycosyltransferase, partial [Kiloniellaceae bacterium]